LDTATFNKFRRLVYEQSGISLGAGKEALVSARVGKRMRALGFDDFRTYLRYLTQDNSSNEIVHLLDAISTNVTSFFREPAHFEFLSSTVDEWLNQGQRRFRFWSAASSTGEEPYSMAMTLLEVTSARSVDLKILATDISTSVLEQCRSGNYEEGKLATVSPVLKERYFDRHQNDRRRYYTAKDVMKRVIAFSRLNLSDPPFPMQGPFDIIFCRNVMIYFDNTVRRALLIEMRRLLRPQGYLVVGHAESLTGMVSDFKSIKPSIYVKQK